MMLDKTKNTLLQVATLVGAITVIAGGYAFFKYNIWKPNVQLISVDFDKGIAVVKFRNKEITVYGNATMLLGGDWGVQLGSSNSKYDRVELVKKGMVYDYIKIK